MHGSPVRVLLVEDDEDDYILVRALLSDIPRTAYELQWAAGFEAALDAVRAAGYDVCLLDFRLKGRDGLAVLEEAIRHGVRAPIILLTGAGDHGLDRKAM